MDTEKTKHTPGPWMVRKMREHYAIESETRRVAEVRHASGPDWDSELDARLIAAAPELLEALRSCLEWMEFTIPKLNETNTHRMNWGGPISKARTAIAKATNP